MAVSIRNVGRTRTLLSSIEIVIWYQAGQGPVPIFADFNSLDAMADELSDATNNEWWVGPDPGEYERPSADNHPGWYGIQAFIGFSRDQATGQWSALLSRILTALEGKFPGVPLVGPNEDYTLPTPGDPGSPAKLIWWSLLGIPNQGEGVD